MPLKRIVPSWQKPITKFFISQSPKQISPTLVINSCGIKSRPSDPLNVTEDGQNAIIEDTEETMEVDKENMNVSAKSDNISISSRKSSSSENLDEEVTTSTTIGGNDGESNDTQSDLEEVEESSGEEKEEAENCSTEEQPLLSNIDIDTSTKEANIDNKPTNLFEKTSSSKTNIHSKKKIRKKNAKRTILRVMIGAKYQRMKVSSKSEGADRMDDEVS